MSRDRKWLYTLFDTTTRYGLEESGQRSLSCEAPAGPSRVRPSPHRCSTSPGSEDSKTTPVLRRGVWSRRTQTPPRSRDLAVCHSPLSHGPQSHTGNTVLTLNILPGASNSTGHQLCTPQACRKHTQSFFVGVARGVPPPRPSVGTRSMWTCTRSTTCHVWTGSGRSGRCVGRPSSKRTPWRFMVKLGHCAT